MIGPRRWAGLRAGRSGATLGAGGLGGGRPAQAAHGL